MLRILFLVLAFLGLSRLVARVFLSPSKSRSSARPPRPPQEPEPPAEPMRDLTQQEISDADFEEIPPEE